jgi:phosphoribosylformylglycinamidine synthase
MTSSANHKAKVIVRYKAGVLDPQGATIQRALADLGMDGIRQVKTGRTFELELDPGATRDTVERACRTLLANPVIETYEIEMPE